MIPLRDNIPSDNFPVVTVVFIAINVLVFLFLQGPSFSLSAGDNVKSEPVVEYGAVPVPDHTSGRGVPSRRGGDHRGGAGPVRGDTRAGDAVCEGTDEAAAVAQSREDVPVKDINQPPAFLTIFTSMFMHGGWLHIIFNMLFLWIFGNNIEDSMGS